MKETLETPISGEYDVIVAGAGVAGVAAAVAAARSGRSTLLLEKTVILGGLATAGFVLYYNPGLCDARGRKLMGGLPEEMFYLSTKYGRGGPPPGWSRDGDWAPIDNRTQSGNKARASGPAPSAGARQWSNGPASAPRLQTAFNPAAFAVALDELVSESNIDLLLDTLACRPVVSGDICEGVVVETKAGRHFYKAKVIIDATGDADLLARAGVPCIEDQNWLTYWALGASRESAERASANNDSELATELWRYGAHPNGKGHPDGEPTYGISSAAEITQFVLRGRELVRRAMHDGRRSLVALSAVPHVRTTRRIVGVSTLGPDDADKRSEDSVGCIVGEVRPHYHYEIPFGALVSTQSANLITAGRTISSIDAAREVTRLIAPCALTGQAAGIAASIAVEQSTEVAGIAIGELQSRLEESGIVIHR